MHGARMLIGLHLFAMRRSICPAMLLEICHQSLVVSCLYSTLLVAKLLGCMVQVLGREWALGCGSGCAPLVAPLGGPGCDLGLGQPVGAGRPPTHCAVCGCRLHGVANGAVTTPR